jgi:serine O-acetyltransferase
MGMAISGKASVGAGSVLCQHVTLGEGLHPVSRQLGAPKVGANVHVGPGATLLGPITIGDDSKIMPGALVMESVPPGSLVEVAGAVVRPRRKHGPAAEAGAGESPGAGGDREPNPSGS